MFYRHFRRAWVVLTLRHHHFLNRLIRIKWIIAITLLTIFFIVGLLINHLLEVEFAAQSEILVAMQLRLAVDYWVIRKIICEGVCHLPVFRLLLTHRLWGRGLIHDFALDIANKRRLEVFGGLDVRYSIDLVVLEIVKFAPIIDFFLSFSFYFGFLRFLVQIAKQIVD